MEYMDSCFFCISTFQLLPIISIALSRNEKADLYIEPSFEKAEIYAERVRRTGIFENVIVIESDSIYNKYFTIDRPGFLNHLEIARTYFKVNDIAAMVLQHDVVYRNMFLSSNAYLPRMVQLSFIKKHRNTIIYLFEDGIGSYFNTINNPSVFDTMLRRFLFGKNSNNKKAQLYLFCPELFNSINYSKKREILRIQKKWNNLRYREIFKLIFPFPSTARLTCKVLILDTVRDELFSKESSKKIDDIYNTIFEQLGDSNTIIKKHPRDKRDKMEEYNYYQYTELPFEIMCMESDMCDKTLVSFSSTACITPKILFDQEPFVILLYKVIPAKTRINGNVEQCFENVRRLYTHKERFIIPKTIEEFRRSINMLCLHYSTNVK